MQLRPPGNDKFYSPQRDIAHIGPEILKRAMTSADPEHREPWYQAFLDDNDITEEVLDRAAHLFFQGAVKVINAEHPVVAMDETGFSSLTGEEQLAIYGKIGQVCLAAIWSGIKDISTPDSEPPGTIASVLANIEAGLQERRSDSD